MPALSCIINTEENIFCVIYDDDAGYHFGGIKRMFDKISFPEHEYESIQKYLDELGYCYTTRLYTEVGKYKIGYFYKAPWGDVLKIEEIKKYWKVSDRPFYDEMTDDEKDLIRKYSEDMGLPYEWIKFSKQTG